MFIPIRHLILTLLCIILSLNISNARQISSEQTQETDDLLPEVEQILFQSIRPKIPEKSDLMQNAYSGILTVHAPESADFLAIGAQFIHQELHKYQAALTTPKNSLHSTATLLPDYSALYNHQPQLELNRKVDGFNYQFPCQEIRLANCLEKTLHDKKSLEALLIQNKHNAILMQRYPP